MAVYSRIKQSELLLFLKKYDIGNLISFDGILEGIENTNYKIITSKNTYILTIFEKRVEKKDLPFFINLKKHLFKKKFKCPQPIPNKYGNIINTINKKPCAILSFLEGKKTDIITTNHCNQIGKILSSLHHATKDFKQRRENTMHRTQWKKLFTKCKVLRNNPYKNIMENMEEEIFFLDKQWPSDLPNGIIHGDLFQDNVFFKKNKISGLIDFYFSCNDFFSYDIAITINAWCFNRNAKFSTDKFHSLINGYQAKKLLNQNYRFM